MALALPIIIEGAELKASVEEREACSREKRNAEREQQKRVLTEQLAREQLKQKALLQKLRFAEVLKVQSGAEGTGMSVFSCKEEMFGRSELCSVGVNGLEPLHSISVDNDSQLKCGREIGSQAPRIIRMVERYAARHLELVGGSSMIISGQRETGAMKN